MGKGGDKSSTSGNATEKLEVLIDGRYYDVTNLKHPGGSVIKFYSGKDIDATQAFNNFHIRSKKAKKYMDSLPSRSADEKKLEKNFLPGQKSLLEDFNQLQRDLEKEGFFKPAPLHVAYRVAEIILLHAVGFYLVFTGKPILGALILGIVTGRCGWLMHEGGHYSLTGNITIDRGLQIILYGVGCGMSASWWRNQHNKHHSMPQKLGHDVDLNTLPLVCFTSKIAKRIGLPMKLWIRAQAFIFPVVTTLLVALGWQLYLHPRHIARQKNLAEAAALATRYGVFAYFVVPVFGLSHAIALYMFYNWVGATYIFLNFAVSHTHLPTVPKDDTQVDWIRYAAIHTMNVHSGPLGCIDWWMSYLNFQIEHHLFPSMPQFRHPIVSKRVKALFDKHGLHYDQRSYGDAMAVTFANLHTVGMEVFYG